MGYGSLVPLTRADLEAIRTIVREEVERVIRGGLNSPAPPADGKTDGLEEDALPHSELLREWARASARRMRNTNPTTERDELLAEARYRLAVDASYEARARRLFRKKPDESVTVEDVAEMLRRRRLTRQKLVG